jgi:uncharacterized protein YhhL (DUF1145 family)
MLANPTLHRVLTMPLFYFFLAAMAVPLLLWAGIARAARRRPEILRCIYPRVKTLIGWLWFVGLACVVLLPHPELKIFVSRLSVLNVLLSGMNLLRMWIGRRIDPDSFKKYEGWWPTPKDSAPQP